MVRQLGNETREHLKLRMNAIMEQAVHEWQSQNDPPEGVKVYIENTANGVALLMVEGCVDNDSQAREWSLVATRCNQILLNLMNAWRSAGSPADFEGWYANWEDRLDSL